jgi:hypothetical protein
MDHEEYRSPVLRFRRSRRFHPCPSRCHRRGDDEDGKVYVRPAEVRDTQAFARVWDRNLKHQGFVGVEQVQPYR